MHVRSPLPLQPRCLMNYTESVLMLSSWKSFFNIFLLTVILAHSLLELRSVIHHHPIRFPHRQCDTVCSLSQIHVSIGYIFCKLIILLFLGITSSVQTEGK